MTRWRFLAASILLASGTARAGEDARPVLTWVMAVPPPIHIADRTGYADETVDWFIAHLPQFRHAVISANSKRLEDMLASSDGVCGGAVFKTPARERDTQFSRPVYWTRPNRLIVSAERPAALDAHLDPQGEVDLPALLADRSFVGGVQEGRSYSSGIDQALARSEAAPGGDDGLVAIRGPGRLDMLASGRFDWTIGFPVEARWWAHRLETSPERTKFLADLGGTNPAYLTRPIAGSTGLVPAYIGCSRQPVGQSAIAMIDRLIDGAGRNPPWIAYYLKWLDADDRAGYLAARDAAVR
jgi:uncharacterized protein (TIGR02285 family)